jgi:tetratricopeptide (TPR) repeat protein
VVQPEPAYLTDDVVPYTEDKEPEQDFDALMQILEQKEDATGLFFLGNTYYAMNQEGFQKAVEAYDAALALTPDDPEALLNNKGVALGELGRHEEAVEAYDAALALRPDHADALYNKGFALILQGRTDEALDHLCKSWERRERLPDGGAALAELFANLGREPGECR